jgi:Na+/proline symporter
MPIGVLFWVLMIIWLLFGLYWHRGDYTRGNYGLVGGNLMLFVLLAILGWRVFGPILQ